MSLRGRSPKPSSKIPPMYSPRLDGVGILSSRAVPPSPLSKGLDGLSGSGPLPSVDYDDVFGGPPRFATSILASQSGPAPSAMLDRATARTPSFRSPSLPVFELPVFGDDVGSSITFEPRTASVAYEDIFREEVQTPDVFPGSNVYGNTSWSKPSSRPSSRRMSPVHPAAALANQLAQEEMLAAANSAAFFKGRSSAGKLSSRCSFSSVSSFDERGRPPDSPSRAPKNDMVTSSLPASPPHTGTWGNVKRFMGSNSASNLANGEIDDVFGGFPHRTYSQAFASIQHDVKDVSNASRSHSGGALPTKFGVGSRVQSAPYGSEPYEGLHRSLSSSSSSNEEQVLHDDFIEIRMDRQSDSSVSEKMEGAAGKVWVTLNDLNVSTQSTPKKMPARPPPAPVAPLKYKSWKDWTSDVPGGQLAGNPSPGVGSNVSTAAMTTSGIKKDLHGGNSVSHSVKGLAESGFSKQLQNNNISADQLLAKYSGSLPPSVEVKAKLAEETLELEERELKAMLTSAWKNNEKRERKKTATKVPQEVRAVLEPKAPETHVKEVKKHSSKQPIKASQPQQSTQNLEDKEADLHWKAWRKYPSKEGKDLSKNGYASHNFSPKVPSLSAHDLAQERDGTTTKLNALSETDDLFDPEEIVKVVTEEMSTNGNVASTERSNSWAGIGLNTKTGQRTEDTEVLTKEQFPKVVKDDYGAASTLSSANDSVQDFVQYSEQIEVSLSGGEDIDCLIDLDHALDGFQEIEGESLERRKARRERHLRAKERVAKALEEMQQRDAEVQRQQEEKQQLAVTSDRQIKRWATGKEGNLRALLSNLQHVLWPESGWQPISLTDLIEGPDVKKAYRKATLFVHPDKVQQKGATLQQKYIAERVFDILQEAWKTFNMQELF